MLVESGDDVVAVAPEGTRRRLLAGAGDAAYSPDGTLVAFARDGDLWLANSDGSGQRRLTATPHIVEWGPEWTTGGNALVYTALVGQARQVRIVRLPTGPSSRLAGGAGGEDWSPSVARNGAIAFASTRQGAPAVYVADSDGGNVKPFDATPSATPPADVRDLAWSPDGSHLAYTVVAADGTSSIVVDDGTTQTTVMTVPGPAGHPVWSATGSRIAYDDGDGKLFSVARDGTDVRALGGGRPLDWRVVPVGRPKFPDLLQRPPRGLLLMRSASGHWLLGFTSMVDNRGPGILWITAHRYGSAHVMEVEQRVLLASGDVRTLPSSGVLHYDNAPPHHHWHFVGFDRYELRRAGDLRLLVRDRKSGFCIADHWGIAPGIAHGPPRFLGDCDQYEPRARFVEEGSSVGYTDRYPGFFHGQDLDITKVPSGLYWLVHQANADFHLREERYDNDTASLLVRIRWRAGTPAVTPLRACRKESC
ncbi:MAG TPA: lysyl oxidase family protein [Gaiellaceae bacterium]|nr:lysyl oxidase family protein [Gaiellaceae bacterium]